jgi:protein tyrosine phosphatase
MSANNIIIKFTPPSQVKDFEEILNDNQHNLLVKASKMILAYAKSDAEHNEAMVKAGLTVHRGSRANNLVTTTALDALLKTLPRTRPSYNPMNNRILNFDNLYRLKTGPRAGAHLGANLFDLSDYIRQENTQKYIATEAPYDIRDYFRMVIDSKSKILISLTTDIDNDENGVFNEIRDGVRVDLHHLAVDDELKIDGYKIKCITEAKNSKKYGDHDFTIKHISFSKGEDSYLIHHFIYKNWLDGKLLENEKDLLDLIIEINKSKLELNSDYSNPITVNCGYGYGRTGSLILFHQLSEILPKEKGVISVEIEPMIKAIEHNIGFGAPVGINAARSQKRIEIIKEQAEYILNHLAN